jgi:hypothetical protein
VSPYFPYFARISPKQEKELTFQDLTLCPSLFGQVVSLVEYFVILALSIAAILH